MNLSLLTPSWRILAGLGLALSALLTFVGWHVNEAVAVAEQMARPHEIQTALERAETGMDFLQDAVQDYLIDGVEAMRVQFEDSVRMVGRNLARLNEVAGDDLSVEDKNAIAQKVDAFVKKSSDVIMLRNGADAGALQKLVQDGQSALSSARRAIETATGDQQSLLQSRAQALRSHVVQVFAGLVAIAAAVLSVAALVILQAGANFQRQAQSQAALSSENERLQEAVRQRTEVLDRTNQDLASLSKRVLRIQEEDRRSIALELHDQIGQGLATLVHMLSRFEEELEKDKKGVARRKTIEQTLEIARTAYGDIHNLALELRPAMLDKLGLVPTLQWFAHQQARVARCEIKVDVDGEPVELPGAALVAAFRIVQEAISNAARHGKARRIGVNVRYLPERLDIAIEDDGIGFDPAAPRDPGDPHIGLGLVGMQERARDCGGSLLIDSTPGSGTRILASLPITTTVMTPAAATLLAAQRNRA